MCRLALQHLDVVCLPLLLLSDDPGPSNRKWRRGACAASAAGGDACTGACTDDQLLWSCRWRLVLGPHKRRRQVRPQVVEASLPTSERERERERESVCVCERERERERSASCCRLQHGHYWSSLTIARRESNLQSRLPSPQVAEERASMRGES